MSCMYRVSSKALMRDGSGRVLLVKEGGTWDLPGGGIEFGETIEDSLHREVLEECAAEIEIGSYYKTVTFQKREDLWILWIVFNATLISPPPLSSQCMYKPIDELDLDELYENIIAVQVMSTSSTL